MNTSTRRWELPLAAAVSSGVPLVVGAAFERLDLGLIASLGGMVFLNVPHTRMRHRMVLMMAAAFAMITCYALGALTHFYPPVMVVALTLLTAVAGMTARFYALGPPGILFLIMAASIAAYSPASLSDIPVRVGVTAFGAIFACMVAFVYSLLTTRRGPPVQAPPEPGFDADLVVVDSVIIAAFVGLSLVVAELLGLPRPYWVPVSCLAVIQGASLRLVWNRHVHRVVGTLLGLALAWGLMSLQLGIWSVVAVMVTLSFVIEILVVRHYGLAMIFITPMTIFLAEATHLGHGSPLLTMQTRALDILLGSVIGLIGGATLHVPGVRARVTQAMRWFWPAKA